MAVKKFLDLTGLTTYDEKIKALIDSKDQQTLESAKSYSDGLSDNYDPAGTAQTKVNELANGQVKTNTDNITALQSGKADKATTLSGYGITDAYTKTQTDSAISTAVANAPHLKRSIVEALPEVGEADANTIYMVGAGDGSQDSVYEEYMLINDGFEKIGSSEVDLTNYATKDYVDTAESDAVATAGTNADSKIAAKVGDLGDQTVKQYVDAAKTAAQSYADSLADNYATAEQGALADSALQKADIVSGNANGTISVDGTDVAVKGLGSAAYTNSTAYDAAGAADTAETNAKEYADSLATNYATAAQGTKADTAVQKTQVTTGTENGTIAVQGTDVPVKGLGSAAYVATTAFDAAGTADTKVNALAEGAVATNTANITSLEERVDDLEALDTYTEITTPEIEALFA